MREFLSAKKNLIIIALIVLIAIVFLGSFLAEFGLSCASCNVSAAACNPLSCVVDGCMGCTNCVGCVLGCN